MSIANITGALAGLQRSTGLSPINACMVSALVRMRTEMGAGDQTLIELAGPASAYIAIRANTSSPGNWSLRHANLGGTDWEMLAGTEHPFNADFVAVGLLFTGTGANNLRIRYSASQGATPIEFVRTMTGATWTPNTLKLLFGSFFGHGSLSDVANAKYGPINPASPPSLQQWHEEAWSTGVQHPTVWTPSLIEPMASGTIEEQRGAFDLVNLGTSPTFNLTADAGPLAAFSGTPPTISLAAATPSGNDLTVAGTFASTEGGPTISVSLIAGATTIGPVTATIQGSNWTAAFTNVGAATYTVRARIVDPGGIATADASVQFIALSGAGELPSTYPNTGIAAQPGSITLAAGASVELRAVNQAGQPIAGAIASIGNPSVASLSSGLTDENGYVTVTGVGSGQSTTVTLSFVNLAGSTVNAIASVTVTAPPVAAVTVSPSTVTVTAGQSQQFSAIISGGGTPVWSVSNGVGSIDSATGLYTAAAIPGTATVTATKSGDPASYGSASVTVIAAAPPPPPPAITVEAVATDNADRGTLSILSTETPAATPPIDSITANVAMLARAPGEQGAITYTVRAAGVARPGVAVSIAISNPVIGQAAGYTAITAADGRVTFAITFGPSVGNAQLLATATEDSPTGGAPIVITAPTVTLTSQSSQTPTPPPGAPPPAGGSSGNGGAGSGTGSLDSDSESSVEIIPGVGIRQDPRYPTERYAYVFVYDDNLANDELITDASPPVTITVRGDASVDPDPQAQLYGPSEVRDGRYVVQHITGGVPGVTYIATCRVNTNKNRILIEELRFRIYAQPAGARGRGST